MADKNFNIALVITARANQAINALHQFSAAMTGSAKSAKAFRESAAGLAVVGSMLVGAGAAIALPLKSGLGAFADQQAELAHIATAMSDGAAQAAHLAEVQQLMIDVSQKSAISALAAGDAYYIARSNMLDHAQALNAVNAATRLTIATTKNAAEAQEQMMPVTRTLTSLYVNFGGSIAQYADQLTKLQTQYSFGTISEVTEAMSYAAPAAKAAGIAVSQMMTGLALLSAGGLHGPSAGTAFEAFVDKLGSDSKLAGFITRTKQGGIDLQATLRTFAEVFGSMSPTMRMRELAAAGLGET